MTSPSFGALLKRYRMAAGLSQEVLAERANVSTRAISDLERGINRAPRSVTLDALLRGLHLSGEERETLIISARSGISTATPSAEPLSMLPAPSTDLIGREEGHSRATAMFRGNRTRLLTLTGLAGVGKTHLALDSAHLYCSFGNLTYTAWCLEGIAALASAEGKHELAACLCAHAVALRLKVQTPLPPGEQTALDNLVATLRAMLSKGNFAVAWEEGTALGDEEGIDLALSWMDGI